MLSVHQQASGPAALLAPIQFFLFFLFSMGTFAAITVLQVNATEQLKTWFYRPDPNI